MSLALDPGRPRPRSERIGPGAFVFVVGPSGAGKDTSAGACARAAFRRAADQLRAPRGDPPGRRRHRGPRHPVRRGFRGGRGARRVRLDLVGPRPALRHPPGRRPGRRRRRRRRRQRLPRRHPGAAQPLCERRRRRDHRRPRDPRRAAGGAGAGEPAADRLQAAARGAARRRRAARRSPSPTTAAPKWPASFWSRRSSARSPARRASRLSAAGTRGPEGRRAPA